ncbi:MAG: hypothetical protein WBO10_00765 [Pyrinomonadaceae bacterium]
MKVKIMFAAMVCVVCFLIGWLTYSATMLFVGILRGQVELCDDRVQGCDQPGQSPSSR